MRQRVLYRNVGIHITGRRFHGTVRGCAKINSYFTAREFWPPARPARRAYPARGSVSSEQRSPRPKEPAGKCEVIFPRPLRLDDGFSRPHIRSNVIHTSYGELPPKFCRGHGRIKGNVNPPCATRTQSYKVIRIGGIRVLDICPEP